MQKEAFSPPPSPIALRNSWVMWGDEIVPNQPGRLIKPATSFNTVAEFEKSWNDMNVTKLPSNTDLYVLKHDLARATRESEALGGKWIVRCGSKEQACSCTKKLVISVLGSSHGFNDAVLGVVMSLRPAMVTVKVYGHATPDIPQVAQITEHISGLTGSSLRYQENRAEFVGLKAAVRQKTKLQFMETNIEPVPSPATTSSSGSSSNLKKLFSSIISPSSSNSHNSNPPVVVVQTTTLSANHTTVPSVQAVANANNSSNNFTTTLTVNNSATNLMGNAASQNNNSLSSIPSNPSMRYPKIVVCGGGPVAMIFAASCAIIFKGNIQIDMYECRWTREKEGEKVTWRNEGEGSVRRNQVVAIQDDVLDEVPKEVVDCIFARGEERVWPTSRNVSVSEITERLLEFVQKLPYCECIVLHSELMDEQKLKSLNGTFDLLVGADGSKRSLVQHICNFPTEDKGKDRAVGVSYSCPTPRLPQPLNVVLTMSQTRYILNSTNNNSKKTTQGFIHVRISDEEWGWVKEGIRSIQEYQEEGSPLWETIRDGLRLFDIPKECVTSVSGMEIKLVQATKTMKELTGFSAPKRTSSVDYPPIACLIGDAAMRHPFWPGRGLNSGIKAAIGLARGVREGWSDNNYAPLLVSNCSSFEGLMHWLYMHEIEGRSGEIVKVVPLRDALVAASLVPKSGYMHKRELLLQRMKKIRDKMQARPEWPHKYTNVEDRELEEKIKKVGLVSVCEMECSGKWPSRQMGSVEVQLARKLKKILLAAKQEEDKATGKVEKEEKDRVEDFTEIVL